MFRSTFLSPSHYAGKWVIPDEDQHHDLKVVNQLGYAYATSPDSPEKEEKLLRLLECFHGYLMKYVVMVVRGTLPPANSRAGKDAKELLRTLAPRKSTKDKSAPSKEVIDATCKMLHLAFKQTTTEDIYDTLAFCFMKAARKYDPYYAEKTKKVCEAISGLPKQFTEEQLSKRVGFDCNGILRSLVLKGYLASVTGKKKVVGYKVGQSLVDLSAIRPLNTNRDTAGDGHASIWVSLKLWMLIRILLRDGGRSKHASSTGNSAS